MAYYSGSVNSFDALRTALIDACTANGWVWADNILSKGAAFVRPYTSASLTTTEGPGLIIEGGTGKSGSSLTGVTAVRPRLGRPGASSGLLDVTWPATYRIFVFNNPDEVYLVLRFNVSYHYWLAFGVSGTAGLGGTGLWLAGNSSRGYRTTGTANNGIGITSSSGGTGTAAMNGNPCRNSCAFFWNTIRSTSGDVAGCEAIHVGLDGTDWYGTGSVFGVSAGAVNAVYPITELLDRSPSAWNSEASLIPIKVYAWRASNKCSLILDTKNARYLRVDYYEPGDLIVLGSDRWMVFPFYLKNASARAGGSDVSDTGTFGWAIRYEGP